MRASTDACQLGRPPALAATKKFVAFRLDLKQIAGLEAVKREVGIPVAEQVRRAIDLWLREHGRARVRVGKGSGMFTLPPPPDSVPPQDRLQPKRRKR